MDELITITQFLRDCLKNDYKNFKNSYFERLNLDKLLCNEDDYYEDFDVCVEENLEPISFEEDVFFKLIDIIKNSKYKNILYLIILNDVYEHIKTKQICELHLFKQDLYLLNTLESCDLNDLFNKMNKDEDFLLDLVTIYIEYEIDCSFETKMKNKKLLELSNNYHYLNKFKINIIDDIQNQYTKTRKSF